MPRSKSLKLLFILMLLLPCDWLNRYLSQQTVGVPNKVYYLLHILQKTLLLKTILLLKSVKTCAFWSSLSNTVCFKSNL